VRRCREGDDRESRLVLAAIQRHVFLNQPDVTVGFQSAYFYEIREMKFSKFYETTISRCSIPDRDFVGVSVIVWRTIELEICNFPRGVR